MHEAGGNKKTGAEADEAPEVVAAAMFCWCVTTYPVILALITSLFY